MVRNLGGRRDRKRPLRAGKGGRGREVKDEERKALPVVLMMGGVGMETQERERVQISVWNSSWTSSRNEV